MRLFGALKIGSIMIGAAALGLACGSTTKTVTTPLLPKAGTAQDDGNGILAQTSGKTLKLGPQEDDKGGTTYGATNNGADDYYYDDYNYYDDYYGGDYYGYGGNYYGASAAAGGTRYANYQFNWEGIPQAYGTTVPATDYVVAEVINPGSISGTVTWPAPPKTPNGLETAVAGCNGQVANHTLQIDSNGRVANAVVYLSDIKSGKAFVTTSRANLQLGGSLEQHACALSPHIQLIQPVGSALKITNSDAGPRTFVGHLWDGDNPRPDESFKLNLRNNAASKKTLASYYGFLRVSTLEPDMPSSAWAVIPPHPYYVITDDMGGFRLDDVPAGTYRLTVWHEPVMMGVDAQGKIILSEPITQTSTIVVRARIETRTPIKLKKP